MLVQVDTGMPIHSLLLEAKGDIVQAWTLLFHLKIFVPVEHKLTRKLCA